MSQGQLMLERQAGTVDADDAARNGDFSQIDYIANSVVRRFSHEQLPE